VGMVKIRRWEKRGDTQRIDFHCGKRALLDYRWKNDAVNALANGLSVKDSDVQAAVERSLAQGRDNFKALEEAQKTLLEYESRLLLAETPVADGMRLIVRTLDGRSSEEGRRLAMILSASPTTIALLGVRGADRASLIFARSADLSQDMNALLKAIAPIVSGRGGGSPSLAQGGGPGLDKLDDALQAAQSMLAAR
jgi:alanyl-tRNA synthetase